MKRVVVNAFGPPKVMTMVEEPSPPPGPGQVRVRITSIGMNHADLMARTGQYRLLSGNPPFTPGLEAGGVIEAVGETVTDRQIGQRVILGPAAPRRSSDSMAGTYRTHFVCPARETWPAPDAISDDQLGAIWLAYLTAWGCLVWKQDLRQGQTVAIPAASSSVGLAAAQIVAKLGGTSIGLTTSADKVDKIKALPACDFDHLIVTRNRDWARDIKELTGGRGTDVFFDPVAAGGYLDTEIRCLASGGTIWLYGLLGETGPVDLSPLIHKSAAIRGWVLFELTSAGPDEYERGCRHILDGFADGTYRQHVDRTFTLEDHRNAHEYMERARHVGKLVLVP